MTELLQTTLPVLALLLNISINISTYKFSSKIGLLKSLFLGFFVGFVFLIAIEIWITAIAINKLQTILSGSLNLAAYGALGYCYFNFVNLGETARRIRLLREIVDYQNGLTEPEILSKYNARIILEKRLERLSNSGQIIKLNDRYYTGKKTMLTGAKIIIAMKLFILGKSSEFD